MRRRYLLLVSTGCLRVKQRCFSFHAGKPGVEGYLTTASQRKDMRRQRATRSCAPSAGQWHKLPTPTFPCRLGREEGWRCRSMLVVVGIPGPSKKRPAQDRRGEGLMRGNVSIKPNAPVQHSSPSRAWACVAVSPVSPDAAQDAIQPIPLRPSPSRQANGRGPCFRSSFDVESLVQTAFLKRGIAVICK